MIFWRLRMWSRTGLSTGPCASPPRVWANTSAVWSCTGRLCFKRMRLASKWLTSSRRTEWFPESKWTKPTTRRASGEPRLVHWDIRKWLRWVWMICSKGALRPETSEAVFRSPLLWNRLPPLFFITFQRRGLVIPGCKIQDSTDSTKLDSIWMRCLHFMVRKSQAYQQGARFAKWRNVLQLDPEKGGEGFSRHCGNSRKVAFEQMTCQLWFLIQQPTKNIRAGSRTWF